MRKGIAIVTGVALAALAAGCAKKAPPPDITINLPPPPPAAATLPPGATPGMKVPARLADGTYPTPNRALTGAAALWHLRAGLNVAALSCDAAFAPRYNALLKDRKAELQQALSALQASYRTAGGGWEERFDDDMTKLYNFFSQTPARPGLCAAADAVLTRVAAVPAASLQTEAPAALAELDRPFTDFYRAYDAWRASASASASTSAPPAARPATS